MITETSAPGMKRINRFIILFFSVLPASVPTAAFSHELATSYTNISVRSDSIELHLILDAADAERISGGPVDSTSVARLLARRLIRFSVLDEPAELESRGGDLFNDNFGNDFIRLRQVAVFSGGIPWSLKMEIGFFPAVQKYHRNLVRVNFDTHADEFVLDGSNPEIILDLSEKSSLTRQLSGFLKLGVHHIFIGYDHILFLLGLIVVGGSVKNLIKIVTSFTIAHSISLALAVFGIILIPGRVVESIIAASLIYVAVENFLVRKSEGRWMITFAFGLVHGLGFASVLAMQGLPGRGMVASLLSFNLGVEVGQVVIVALIFPLVRFAEKRGWERKLAYSASSAVLLFGVIWFVERVF
jgi:hypothetical protein